MLDPTPITTSALILTAVAFALTYFSLHVLISKKWLRPTASHTHVMYGGVVIIAIICLCAALVLRNSPLLLMSLVGAALVVLIAGSKDEHSPLPAGKQLILQALAATVAVAGGWTIQFISQPAGDGVIIFNPALGAGLAVVWLLLLMNAINWLDGVDGLASSVGSLALATLAAVSLLPSVQNPTTFALALIGLATLGGFLLWNFPPARVYLGTSGSWWLGLYIGLVAIEGGGKIATTLLVLALPVVDVLAVCLQRLRAGQAPWHGDTTHHLHYRLLQRGLSPRAVTLSAIAVTALLGIGALILQTQQKIAAFFIAAGLIVVATLALAMAKASPFRKKSRLARIVILFGLVVVIGTITLTQKPCRNFKEGQAVIEHTTWSVAIADTPEEHNRGLMECANLPNGSGLYFIFKQPSAQPFWMKNMLLPLDIIWISEGRIIEIERNVPVAGDNPNPPRYYAPGPYTAVLEIPAGEAAQQGLAVGQTVTLETNN